MILQGYISKIDIGYLLKKIAIYSILSIALLVLPASKIYAQNDAIAEDVVQLLENLQSTLPPGAVQISSEVEQPRISYSSDGYIRNLSAPPSHYFPVAASIKGNSRATAYNFIHQYAHLFGVTGTVVDFKSKRSRKKESRSYERFHQTYEQITIFGAEVIVQLNSLQGVEYIGSDISRNIGKLDSGDVSIIPTVSAIDAVEMARDMISAQNSNAVVFSTEPQLMIFDPSILGSPGDIRLVWSMRVYSEEDSFINEEILLDAHNGELVRDYPVNKPALNRTIYDANNSTAYPGTLRRGEGDPASAIADVDDAYDFLGDTYQFYWNNHSRDSMNGSGVSIAATVRACNSVTDCPMANAYGGSTHMKFGQGWAADDMVGHEYTHGVTANESNLIYENQSGAMNESFSDVWGEFIDLGNGAGTDTQAVRWLLGEDLPGTNSDIRDMADPPVHGDPDRMGSTLYYKGTGDNGGVHTNSGVNNKLSYLLTDGDTFNGETVVGMGIARVADLYYEAQTNILTSSSDYYDLYYALRQAAINLGWTTGDRNNLFKACQAVEIVDATGSIYVDGNHSGLEFGTSTYPFNTVTEGYNSAHPGDKIYIRNGPFNEAFTFVKTLDLIHWSGSPVIIGQ